MGRRKSYVVLGRNGSTGDRMYCITERQRRLGSGQKPERKSGRAREMQKKHSSRERDGKEQMVDGRAARVQRTGGSRMHRHVGKKHAGCRQSREKSGKNAASGK